MIKLQMERENLNTPNPGGRKKNATATGELFLEDTVYIEAINIKDKET